MARVHVSRELVEECQDAEYIAAVLANRVKEEQVYLVRGSVSDYEVRFACSYAFFRVDNVHEMEENNIGFNISLVAGNNVLWRTEYGRISLNEFDTDMHRYGEHGFPGEDGKTILWGRYACAPNLVEIKDDMFYSAPEYPEDSFGDGKDLEKFAGYEFGHNTQGDNEGYDGGSSGDDYGDTEGDDGGSSDEETSEYGVSDARFGKELGRVQPCIVPDGITQIRVVALKFEGNVVAFRFKTNVGAFDMRKSVALGYGLGGFKTETFIALKSVNGMLMSDSERKRHVCVPDVSDCVEDCDKLMKALFGN